MRFSVTELQRYYLEVLAFIDYIEIYKPRMDGARSPAKELASCIGAFTSLPRVVQDFVEAGLPVYFIRPAAAVFTASPPKILKVVSLLEPEAHLVLCDATPRFLTIFRGSANSPMKHLAMHRYSRTWMVYKNPHDSTAAPISVNPFQNNGVVPNASDIRGEAELLKAQLPQVSVASGSGTTAPLGTSMFSSLLLNQFYTHPMILDRPHQHKKRRPTDRRESKQGRDTFSDYASDLLPPSKSFWRHALASVDHVQQLIVSGAPSHEEFQRFALPDPHFIITPQNPVKRTSYLIAWIRFRPTLFFVLRRKQRLLKRGQEWWELLELVGRNSGSNQNSFASSVRDKLLREFEETFEAFGQGQMLVAGPTAQVAWKGTNISINATPPYHVFHEVLWELFEVNFRFELFALDKRASTLKLGVPARLTRIVKCFPDGDMIPPTIPSDNEGLVATSWKDRAPFTAVLMEILRYWPHSPSMLHSLSRGELKGEFELECWFLCLEDIASKFYCQTFWNYFGRAPILPRRI